MNITDFDNSANEVKPNIEAIKQSDEFKSVEEEYADLIEKFLDNYGKMSEDELLAEMLSIVAKKKREGSFDAEKIKKLVTKIEPFLNDEQRVKINNLLNFLV